MIRQITIAVIFAWLIALMPQPYVGDVKAAPQMPSFELEDVVSGDPISSSSFQGKSLLITFWATWCPPCIQEIPNLIKLQNEYGANGFSVVAISVDQEKGVVQKMVNRKEINYPVMMADKAVTRDFGGVYGIPTSFLVSKKGTVVKRYSGFIPHSVLVKDLQQIIN
ncbi:MAG: TlpA family protein disulfide reductase [Desulfofustis sp.]|nr:TlpA family protein disulfide reductase [Desulfofustis sp.]